MNETKQQREQYDFGESVLVNIDDLKPAKHNPKRRTTPANVRKLKESIERIGLLYPILVDEENNIIAGHRRWTACKALGWKKMPCKRLHGVDAEAVYADEFSSSRRLTGSDQLEVYLKNPNCLPETVRRTHDAMMEDLGVTLVKKMSQEGLSAQVWQIARRCASLLGRTNKPFIKKVVKWLMEKEGLGRVNRALAGQIPSNVLLEAIQKNRALVWQWQ